MLVLYSNSFPWSGLAGRVGVQSVMRMSHLSFPSYLFCSLSRLGVWAELQNKLSGVEVLFDCMDKRRGIMLVLV